MQERTFTRNDVTVTTSKPATATQLVAEGWREVVEYPTERPEPAPEAFPRPQTPRDRAKKRVEAGEPVTPPFDTPPN